MHGLAGEPLLCLDSQGIHMRNNRYEKEYRAFQLSLKRAWLYPFLGSWRLSLCNMRCSCCKVTVLKSPGEVEARPTCTCSCTHDEQSANFARSVDCLSAPTPLLHARASSYVAHMLMECGGKEEPWLCVKFVQLLNSFAGGKSLVCAGD